MSLAAAAILAALLSLAETLRHFRAPWKFYRHAAMPVLARMGANAASALVLAAVLQSTTSLGDWSIIFTTGLAGPAALRAKIISLGTTAIASPPSDEREREVLPTRRQLPVGPAVLYDLLQNWSSGRIASAVLSAQNDYVRSLVPRLKSRGESPETLHADLVAFLSLLEGLDDTAIRLFKADLDSALADPTDDDARLERLVKKALLNGWHKRVSDRADELRRNPLAP